jgi:hypothetical protein
MNAAEENQAQSTPAIDPAVQVAEAPSPNPTDQDQSTEARERDEKGRYRNPLQPRIDELTRDKHDARREAEYWKRRAEAFDKKPEAEAPKAKPTPDKFDDYGAYVEALADWKAEEKVSAKLSERDNATQAKQREESRATSWQKGVEEAKKVHPDYEDVLAASEVPIAEHVQELLLDAESGPRLAYYLDRNPHVADRLNGMTPTQAARELGRIEATFSAAPAPAENPDETPAPAKETAPPAKARTTAAPAPARPAASGSSTTRPLEKMGMDEYVETRRKQGASWARR